MTCKDCLHHDTCIFTDDVSLHGEDVSKSCGCFADKSRLIELPCKVGDVAFAISDNAIAELKVEGMQIDFKGLSLFLLCPHFPLCAHEEPCAKEVDVCRAFAPECEIGKNVFLNRDEAEKALNKRRRKNGKE